LTTLSIAPDERFQPYGLWTSPIGAAYGRSWCEAFSATPPIYGWLALKNWRKSVISALVDFGIG
jgi:hypothetical protein